MFSESSSPVGVGKVTRWTVAVLLGLCLACGHKEPPFPPPLRHPANSNDLVAVQRGEEIILSFAYPQTTVSGTAVEPLQLVEYWKLDRSVPQWVPPDEESDEAIGEASAESGMPVLPAGEGETDTGEVEIFEGVAGSGDDPSRQAETREPNEGQDALAGDGEEEQGAEEESDLEEDADEDEAAPPPEPPTKEELLKIDGREFSATATLQTTLEGEALGAAVFGDQIVLALPIEPLEEQEVTPESEASAESEESEMTDEAEPEPQLEHGSLFAIKTGISQKHMSGFSNVVVIARRTAPEPPDSFTVTPEPSLIRLEWPIDLESPIEGELKGFHVYRRDAQSPVYGPPLAFVPLEDPRAEEEEEEDIEEPAEAATVRDYSDRTALYGQRYIYALTAVSNREPVVESAITIEREVDYADRFAPSVPQNVIALAEAGRVRLLWNASPQDDVAGYFVARSERGGEFRPLFETPIDELEYSDREVRSGQVYAYRVVALDETGNESEPSEVVEVRAP